MKTVKLGNRTYEEHDLSCPDCSSPMHLTLWDGNRPYYRCSQTGCRGSHSAHPDGTPLGTPAPWPIREARKKTHAVFDRLWSGYFAVMSRDAAYEWLSVRMRLPPEKAHIALFNEDQCNLVLHHLWDDFALRPPPEIPYGQFVELSL